MSKKLNKLEDILPFIDKPIYVKGYCWSRSFDGWTVIYKDKNGVLNFDYRGISYSVVGFLPNQYTSRLSSNYNNGFYENNNTEEEDGL